MTVEDLDNPLVITDCSVCGAPHWHACTCSLQQSTVPATLDRARDQLRAALSRCYVRPAHLEERVDRVLALLAGARELGRGHAKAIAEAVKLVVDLEQHARETSPQGELFP